MFRLRLNFHFFSLIAFFLTIHIAFALNASAGNSLWFKPSHTGPNMINMDLTPQRALSSFKPSWDQQLVLWEGRAKKHVLLDNDLDYILLGTTAGEIPVYFSRKARNLEYDRTGYRMAVKGYLNYENGQFSILSGQSVILLEPPIQYNYKDWRGTDKNSLTSFLAWRIQFHNPQEPLESSRLIASKLSSSTKALNLDPLFFASLIQIESAYDKDAVSVSGAKGLGQLMPRTAEGLGVKDALNPEENIAGSSKMVSGLMNAWKNSANQKAAVLASYNAGPTLVRSLNGQVPNIAETTNYVYFIGYVNRDMQKLVKRYNVQL